VTAEASWRGIATEQVDEVSAPLAALLRKQGVHAQFRVVPDEVHDTALTFVDLVSVYGDGADFLVTELGGGRKK